MAFENSDLCLMLIRTITTILHSTSTMCLFLNFFLPHNNYSKKKRKVYSTGFMKFEVIVESIPKK